ncbi:unnamed protein product [Rotaria sp. Silwood1]|nr:unnamed protein product [Rotaria sp. Silwood1]
MMDPLKRLRLIKYAILQTTMGPSLICDLFVFIYFIRHWRKEILMKPQNHVIACLLIASFIQKITDSPFTLYYLRWGIVVQETYTFCAIWNWLHYSLTCVSLHLLTWYCIERHLFIFHSQMMKKKYCLILFHYIPLIVCSLYTPVFYIRYIFFPPKCVNVWYYTIMLCVAPCYTYTDKFLNSFDWLFHYVPIFQRVKRNYFLYILNSSTLLHTRSIIDYRGPFFSPFVFTNEFSLLFNIYPSLSNCGSTLAVLKNIEPSLNVRLIEVYSLPYTCTTLKEVTRRNILRYVDRKQIKQLRLPDNLKAYLAYKPQFT